MRGIGVEGRKKRRRRERKRRQRKKWGKNPE